MIRSLKSYRRSSLSRFLLLERLLDLARRQNGIVVNDVLHAAPIASWLTW